jgi:hypothetical protein
VAQRRVDDRVFRELARRHSHTRDAQEASAAPRW